MPKFKIIISHTDTGKSEALEIEDVKAQAMIGRRIGETIDGSIIDMKGTELQIMGGSDKDGFPMRRGIHGGIRVNAVLSDRPGFHPKDRGERRRKMIRGDTITEETAQINMKTLATPKEETKNKRKKAGSKKTRNRQDEK